MALKFLNRLAESTDALTTLLYGAAVAIVVLALVAFIRVKAER
jgi:hypothetical protein